MSYVPAKAMKHAHVEAPVDETVESYQRALDAVVHPPLWTMIAAGVAGALATALVLSLRSSTPAKRPPARRKPGPQKKKTG